MRNEIDKKRWETQDKKVKSIRKEGTWSIFFSFKIKYKVDIFIKACFFVLQKSLMVLKVLLHARKALVKFESKHNLKALKISCISLNLVIVLKLKFQSRFICWFAVLDWTT